MLNSKKDTSEKICVKIDLKLMVKQMAVNVHAIDSTKSFWMFTENMCFANFKEYLHNSKLCQIKMSHQQHHTVLCEVTYKMTNFLFATQQELQLLFQVLPILNFIESSLDISIDYRKLKRVTIKITKQYIRCIHMQQLSMNASARSNGKVHWSPYCWPHVSLVCYALTVI